MTDNNHAVLAWSVSAIRVGVRHRKDLGDIEALKDSIRVHGLLQPLTITEDGVLICGRRRLEAIRQLGWKQVNVWVRVGLSAGLSAMMAEREDQANLKPYTVTEMADMYEQLKKEIASDAARRVQANQFGASSVPPDPGGVGNLPTPPGAPSSGLGNLPTPLGAPIGDSRVQAAQMIGGAGYKTMEKVVAIREIAADTSRPAWLRDQAGGALKRLEAGEAVDPLFTALRAQTRRHDLEQIAADPSEPDDVRDVATSGIILLHKVEAADGAPLDLDKVAKAALDRVNSARHPTKPGPAPKLAQPVTPVMKTLKWFIWTWDELKNWPQHVDPVMIAAGLTEPQWHQFQQTIADSVAFMDKIAQYRT